MHIELSEHFTYSKLLRFTFPSIIMMALTSIYGVVDGFFISNFIGAEPFAAVNIVMPFLMIFGAVGFMIGTGGSALVPFILQNVFQSFLVTAEDPQLGLVTTLVSGVLNIVLDALFIAVFRWGVAADANARHKWCCGIWRDHVCELYLSVYLYRLFDGKRTDRRLPLWRGKQRRTKESFQKKPQDHSGHEHSSDHSGRNFCPDPVDLLPDAQQEKIRLYLSNYL